MRADERGAALFVVVLIVVLLTAIGAFAAHATAFTQTAAGYARRSSSAFYIGEFATNLAVSYVATKPADRHAEAIKGDADCRSNAGVVPPSPGARLSCLVLTPPQMANLLDSTITGDPDGAVFGALSRPDRPAEQAIRASYIVEMTDVGQSGEGVAGEDLKNKVWRATLTTTAIISPFTASPNNCNEDTSRSSENLSFRGYVIFPN